MTWHSVEKCVDRSDICRRLVWTRYRTLCYGNGTTLDCPECTRYFLWADEQLIGIFQHHISFFEHFSHSTLGKYFANFIKFRQASTFFFSSYEQNTKSDQKSIDYKPGRSNWKRRPSLNTICVAKSSSLSYSNSDWASMVSVSKSLVECSIISTEYSISGNLKTFLYSVS